MSTHVKVAPAVIQWALDRGGTSAAALASGGHQLKVEQWLTGEAEPTVRQLQRFAHATGVAFGYLMLPEPPRFSLPMPDFRAGLHASGEEPSADLAAVVYQSQQRQEWFLDYVETLGIDGAAMVGIAEEWSPEQTAQDMRTRLGFSVANRHGLRHGEVRKHLLRGFEELGGLTVVTSMVGNNNRRMLNADEFRGFSLVNPVAPLVFVNANQTGHGQLFTLAHEFAHVWRGSGGIGNQQAPDAAPSTAIERWCNRVAAEFLVPGEDLLLAYPTMESKSLVDTLEALARRYRCGTLVVLLQIRRLGLRPFEDFDAEYRAELTRLGDLAEEHSASRGGNYYNIIPLRIGERLSRALVADTHAGRTTIAEALRLMSMTSVTTFDRYADHLQVA